MFKSSLFIDISYFWTLYPFPLFIDLSVQCCFDCYDFMSFLKSHRASPLTLSLFYRYFDYARSFEFSYAFRINWSLSTNGIDWDFELGYTESIDQIGENWRLKNSEPSDPWTGNLSPFFRSSLISFSNFLCFRFICLTSNTFLYIDLVSCWKQMLSDSSQIWRWP